MMRTDPPGSNAQRAETGPPPCASPDRPRSAQPSASQPTVLTMAPPPPSSARSRDARRPAQQLHLLPVRRREQLPQLGVAGIALERRARLANRRVDDPQVPLDQRDGLRPQPPALHREGRDELGGGLLVVGGHRSPTLPRRAVDGGGGRYEAGDAH